MSVKHAFQTGERHPEDPSLSERPEYLGKKDQGIGLIQVFNEILTETILKPVIGKRVRPDEVHGFTCETGLRLEDEVGIHVKPPLEHIKPACIMYLPEFACQIKTFLPGGQIMPFNFRERVAEFVETLLYRPFGESKGLDLEGPRPRRPVFVHAGLYRRVSPVVKTVVTVVSQGEPPGPLVSPSHKRTKMVF